VRHNVTLSVVRVLIPVYFFFAAFLAVDFLAGFFFAGALLGAAADSPSALTAFIALGSFFGNSGALKVSPL
jgi:uncharacterized membrane protein